MKQEIEEKHLLDNQGNPEGGWSESTGIKIRWQAGPLGRGVNRQKPNGAFVETVLLAVLGRLKFYQVSKFKCEENQLAIVHINAALDLLENRTKDRDKREVEGTNQI